MKGYNKNFAMLDNSFGVNEYDSIPIQLQNRDSKNNINISYLTSVSPVRNTLRPVSNIDFTSRSRKRIFDFCDWKCVAITFIMSCAALLIALICLLSSAQFFSAAPSTLQNLCRDAYKDEPGHTSESNLQSPMRFASSAFEEVQMDKLHSTSVPSNSHWNIRFVLPAASLMKFSFTFSMGTTVGVYASRDAIPSHTNYDFAEILGRGKKSRSSDKHGSGDFVQFLEKGAWYISVFNDATTKSDIGFVMARTEESSIPCPFDCHGHGVCVMGSCKCDDGYDGESCSHRTCPVLCSSRGQYVNGECRCNAGWKGKECQLREEECEVADCKGHGDCIDGICHCFPGYKGSNCDQMDCLHPDCSGHGHCVSGVCVCNQGWKGADCSEMDNKANLRCLPDCSSHGTFDLNTQQCICNDNWLGPDCANERCDLDCGPNGSCENNECICKMGWSGNKCSKRLCDARCLEHGQCRNGTCHCEQGWNGRHCTLDGCPKNCNKHGTCAHIDNEWQCQCNAGYTGIDCAILLESHCSDKTDNDNDGLIDCADNECCSQKECVGNPLCHASGDPLDVLLKKQPPTATASFFQRMQFLIDEDSVQSYAHKQAFNDSLFWKRFNPSRVSVIRGQVVNENGQGLIGVRVSVAGDLYLGFTLSRENGWFDLMVNGGGSINLHFQRDPFKIQHKTVMVPWNKVLVIDRVMMSLEEKNNVPTKISICIDHDYDLMKPTVLTTWQSPFQGSVFSNSTDSQEIPFVQELLPIPGTNLHLIYHSSRVSGYLSTVELQLTPEKIPATLRLVHLKISVAGNLFEKVFEADPNLMFTYGWNRRNAYRQKVYGVATASVHVGYEYSSCSNIIWEIQTLQLTGHDMSISEIGGWNLEIHHRYNFQEGILQKGDGQNVYLKQQPKLITTIMGDGQQRPLNCHYCSGNAKDQRLLAPVALAAAPDGSLFIGDFNLIRRLYPDGTVKTVVELNPSSVVYKYHIAFSSNDGKLYVSDPEKHQILRATNIEEPIDARSNLEVVVGSGVKCLPGDKLSCGDGHLARDARLSYPKGIAISVSGELYIADGTTIRFVDQLGIIHTLIGDHYHKSHWKPLPCLGSIPLQKVALRWPTQLAISPVDNSLHILDDYMVLKVTSDRRLRVIAGRPSHCASVITGNQEDSSDSKTQASEVFLESPQSIAFASNGDLYISESDSTTINRVRIVHATDGKISRFVGVDLNCSCLDASCECYNEEILAANAKLNTIPAIAVTPDDRLHVCDQDNLRIRTVMSPLPQPNSNDEYEIVSPDTPETYVFNRHGQHVSTKSSTTGSVAYAFRYNMNTSFGKLSSVTDATGNIVYIMRDYTNEVKSIENTQGGKCQLEMSRVRMLQSFMTPDNFVVKFNYYGASGLLESREEAGKSVVYTYDKYGRLLKTVRT